MTALSIDCPLSTEFLTSDELVDLTGLHRSAGQIKWLSENGWIFAKTQAGDPKVGRWYARLKLAGITPNLSSSALNEPNFGAVR